MYRFLRIISVLALLFSSLAATAQMPEVEMADSFRSEGKIYVVVVIAGIVFAGIVVYLTMIDRKIRKLEKKIDK